MNAKKAKQLRRIARSVARETLPASSRALTYDEAVDAAYRGMKRAARRHARTR